MTTISSLGKTERVCSVDGCIISKIEARGWCRKHYERWKRNGDPLGGRIFPISKEEATKLRTAGLKRCSQCKEIKLLEQFYVASRNLLDGRMSECSACHRPTHREVRCVGVGEAYPGHNYVRDNTQRKHGRPRLCPDHSADVLGWKICVGCVEVLPTSAFGRHKSATDGFRSSCKDCRRDTGSTWRRENPDRVKAIQSTRRAQRLTDGAVSIGLSWHSLVELDGFKCSYCGILTDPEDRSWGTFGPTYPTLDHMVPLIRGGDHTIENSCLACGECNTSKNNKTLEQWFAAGGPPRLRRMNL